MEWIDVRIQPPENDINIIGCCDDDVFECHHFDDGAFISASGRSIEVQFWMPLPDSPYQTGQVNTF